MSKSNMSTNDVESKDFHFVATLQQSNDWYCFQYKRHAALKVEAHRVFLESPSLVEFLVVLLHLPLNPSMSSSINDADQRKHDPSAREQTVNADMSYLRSQHPDFSTVQASRPDWDQDVKFTLKKTKDPEWKYGDGATDGGESLKKTHVGIDPYEEGRPSMFNYKLLISGIIPRPIGFISTRSADGEYFPTISPDKVLIRIREIHQPCSLLIHQRHQSRSAPLHHRHRRRSQRRQRHAAQPAGHLRMHPQHHLRALPRSRQRHLHQRPVRRIGMGPERAPPCAVRDRILLPGPGGRLLGRGQAGRDQGV